MISSALGLPFPLGLDLLMLLPAWLGYFMLGLLVLGLVGAGGFVLARLGRSPLWALALVVPLVQVLAWWALAFSRWPREKTKAQAPLPAEIN